VSRARISWHFGASAGRADARRRDAGKMNERGAGMKKQFLAFWAASILTLGFLWIGMAGAQTKPQAKSPAKEPSKVELNKATAEQLGRCPGLNATLARAIVEYRQKSGPFKTSEDILKVKGITREILGKLNPKIEKDILFVTPAAPSSDEDEEEPSLKPSKC
jgi:competence protein ComEA